MFEEGDGFFGPGELAHELAGEAFDGGWVAVKEIVIVAFYDFWVDSEVVIFGDEEVLNLQFAEGVFDIYNEVSEVAAITS